MINIAAQEYTPLHVVVDIVKRQVDPNDGQGPFKASSTYFYHPVYVYSCGSFLTT